MTRNAIPIILAMVLIVVLSAYEGLALKGRWGSRGAEAEELGARFVHVPKEFEGWKGEDLPVDEIVKKTAGAVNYVSRRYVHASSGKAVVLWLIVGHSRDIVRHTPNICYPNSGFRQTGTQQKHHIDLGNGKEAVFYTSKFQKEDVIDRHTERVFWAWNHPDKNLWEAPENARWHYGHARALYKVYFTSDLRRDESTIDSNAAAQFAKLMLPKIDEVLFPTSESLESLESSDKSPELESGQTSSAS